VAAAVVLVLNLMPETLRVESVAVVQGGSLKSLSGAIELLFTSEKQPQLKSLQSFSALHTISALTYSFAIS